MTNKRRYEDKLKVIAEMAKRDKTIRFSTLAYMVNESSLAQSYEKLNKRSACGSDGETVEGYGNNLATNIAKLNVLIRAKKYKPRPVKRVYIPKEGKDAKRPLGLPSVGAPRKADINQLVKIQLGQRLATSPKLNPTFREVTN